MLTASATQAPQTVYLNSWSAKSATGNSNQLIFSFPESIQKAPHDLVYAKLTSFVSYNSFANISESQRNNKLQIINCFYNAATSTNSLGIAPGGKFTITTNITIPDNHYSSTSLLAYLNSVCNQQMNVSPTNWVTNSNSTQSILFLGLGYNGLNNTAATTPVTGFILSSDAGKFAISAAGTGTTNNAYLKTYTTGNITVDPYVYMGVYLAENDNTRGCMQLLGLSNNNVSTPYVFRGINSINPDSSKNIDYRGFGFTFNQSSVPNPIQPKTLSYVFNLAGPAILYFTIDNVPTNSLSNDTFMNVKNIIASIPVNGYYDGQICYTPENSEYDYVQDLDTNSFTVTIYDQYQNIVDFRGISWQASLQFLTKTNVAEDTFNRKTANLSSKVIYDTGVPTIHNKQFSKPNAYGGNSTLGGLYRPLKRKNEM